MKQSLRAGLIVLTVAGLITGGVALATDDDGGGAAAVPAAEEEGPVRAGLRERLQPLVDDGTISADQADAVTEHLADGARRMHHRPNQRGGLQAVKAAAEFLGLTGEELRAALADGSTLADVAAANGSSAEALISHLTGLAAEKLDEAVAGGRITEDQKAEALARMTEKLTDTVNNGLPERPERGDRGPGHRGPHHGGPRHPHGEHPGGAPQGEDAGLGV